MEFRTHADGWIFIGDENNPSTESYYPISWWITQEPGYSPPTGTIWEWYVQGKFHYTFDNINQYNAVYPWADGDIYIAKKNTYDANYAIYLNTPQTLTQAKALKIQEL